MRFRRCRCACQPRVQHVNVDREVSLFTRAALMHDTSDGIIAIKKWTSRHALGEFLLDFDKFYTMLDGQRADVAVTDVELIARTEARITDRSQQHPDCDGLR